MRQTKKINWKRLTVKAVEEGVKKVIELTILAIIIGATMKVILVAVPAVSLGAVVAKLVKIQFG